MIFAQFRLPGPGHASYLLGCDRSGQALVFDPHRDVDCYLAGGPPARAADRLRDGLPLFSRPCNGPHSSQPPGPSMSNDRLPSPSLGTWRLNSPGTVSRDPPEPYRHVGCHTEEQYV